MTEYISHKTPPSNTAVLRYLNNYNTFCYIKQRASISFSGDAVQGSSEARKLAVRPGTASEDWS